MKYAVIGDHNFICEECGITVKASKVLKRWDGAWVCKQCWEPRQPQDSTSPLPVEQAFPRPVNSQKIAISSTNKYFTITDGNGEEYTYSCGANITRSYGDLLVAPYANGYVCTGFSFTLKTPDNETEIVPATLGGGDMMGYSCDLNSDGTVGIFGAPNDGSGAGSIYVQNRAVLVWSDDTKLTYSAATTSSQIGTDVAINDDGDMIVSADINSQKLVIWRKSGGSWSEDTVITPTTAPTASSKFGSSLAMNGDGTRIAAATWDASAINKVWIFDYDGASWSETIVITPSVTNNNNPGLFIALSSNGDYLVIGDPYNDTGGTNRGYFFIHFVNEGGASLWGEQYSGQASLTPTDNDLAGKGVDLDCDGDTCVIGVPGRVTGYIDVYNRSGSTWTNTDFATNSIGSYPGSNMGWDLSLSRDGLVCLCGTPNWSGADEKGLIFVMDDSDQDGTWTQSYYSNYTNRANTDHYGWSVALSATANWGIGGIPGADDGGANSGIGLAHQFYT